MAVFSYKTGVWPISLEISGARLVMNQDGSVQLMVGATEIGQGSDTVFFTNGSRNFAYKCGGCSYSVCSGYGCYTI